MSFFMLNHLTSTDIVEKKQRISLVVNYSIQTLLIFFTNSTYVHFDRQSKQIIKEGKLPFTPSNFLQSKVKGRVVLQGLNEQKAHYIACLNVEQDYLIQTRELSNVKPECTTKHHLFEPKSKENQTFYIVRIHKNIENGIAVEVFDFYRNAWQEEMLYLNSKFLQYLFVDTSKNGESYKQIGQLYSHTFALISQGQRFESINYSKIKVSHINNEEGLKLKVKFIITRQLKIKQHFVIIGCMHLGENKLLLAGNSKFQGEHNLTHHSSTFLTINTQQIQMDQPQNVKIIQAFTHNEGQGQLMLRSFIGLVQRNMVFLAKIGDKKLGITKINQKICQVVMTFDMKKIPNLMISSLKDSIYCYSSKLQNFFQKIKAEPSILEFELFRIENKERQYRKLIKEGFPQLSQQFTDMILYLL